MAAQRTLYFATGSYYSGKAVLALLERRVPFTKQLVNLMTGEQNEPWYLKINKAGQVPYLIDGDKQLTDSDEIVKHVDSVPEGKGPRLVPAEGTQEWTFFQTAHALLNPLPIPVLTFGTLCHPDLSPGGIQFPAELRKARLQGMMQISQVLQRKGEQHPELAAVYQRKAERATQFAADFQDRAKVEAAIQTVVDVFTKLDQQLAVTTSQSPDNWLCGPDFTAADLLLVILITRVTYLGLDPKCFSADLNPRVKDFWDRAQRRESVQEFMKVNVPPSPK